MPSPALSMGMLCKRDRGAPTPWTTFPCSKQTKKIQRGVRNSQDGRRADREVEVKGCILLGAQRVCLRERAKSWDTGTGAASRTSGVRPWEGLWSGNEPDVLNKQKTVGWGELNSLHRALPVWERDLHPILTPPVYLRGRKAAREVKDPLCSLL